LQISPLESCYEKIFCLTRILGFGDEFLKSVQNFQKIKKNSGKITRFLSKLSKNEQKLGVFSSNFYLFGIYLKKMQKIPPKTLKKREKMLIFEISIPA